MPVTGTETVIKEEVVLADTFEVIAIHIIKPVDLAEENNPPRLPVVWACLSNGVDTGETVEVNLEGQEAVDFITSDLTLYANILSSATALGKDKGALPIDAA